MPRRRMIDPKFWEDETIGKLDREERLFYIGLFSLADDEGRICGSPTFLRSQIYSYDDIPLDSIVTWIRHLQEIGLIHVYDDPSGNGNTYIDHPKWFKYQRIDNPSPSLLPPCPLFRSHWRKPRTVIKKSNNHSKNDSKNDSRVKEVKGSKRKLKEVKEEVKRSKDKNLPSPSAVFVDNSVDKSKPKSQKPTFQEIQDEQIERTIYGWQNKFKEKIEPSQVGMLVFGSRKGRQVYGFKSFEALWRWMFEQDPEKIRESAFKLALIVAKTEAQVKPFQMRAWTKKKDAQLLGDVMLECMKRSKQKEA